MLDLLHAPSPSNFYVCVNIFVSFCIQFQKKQMEKYCLGNGNSIGNLPSTPQSLTTLFTHLLYDDSKRIVFCYVPKNGCSNMKRLLLILNGLLPPESSKQNRPSEMRLKKVS
jgi:hypothetical protein